MHTPLQAPVAIAPGAASAQAATLHVSIQGVKNDHGTLYFVLFDRAGFLKKPLATLKAEPGNPVAAFENLSSGSYAVSVFQDLNGNGVLDRNIIGAPLEPFGFSNDVVGVMGPPRFEAAAGQVDSETLSISIKLR